METLKLIVQKHVLRSEQSSVKSKSEIADKVRVDLESAIRFNRLKDKLSGKVTKGY